MSETYESLPDFGHSPEKTPKKEKSVERPPIEEWISQYIEDNKDQQAIHLIKRVMELHLSEGLRLVAAFAKRFPNFGNDEMVPARLLLVLAYFSGPVEWHPQFFMLLKEQLSLVKTGGGISAEYQLLLNLIESTLQEMETPKTRKIVGHKDFVEEDSYAKYQNHGEDFIKKLHLIDEYYVQFVKPTLKPVPLDYFPEPPKKEKWQESILNAAEDIALQKNGNLPIISSVKIQEAVTAAEEKFGEDWFEKDITLIEHEDAQTNEEKEKGHSELVHRYNIEDVLPAGAKSIIPHTTTSRGLIIEYQMKGETYFWFDGASYKLDSLSLILAITKDHFVLEGQVDGKDICVVDGEYCVGTLDHYERLGENLVAYIQKDNDPTPEVWINGKKLDKHTHEVAYKVEFVVHDVLVAVYCLNTTTNQTSVQLLLADTLQEHREKLVSFPEIELKTTIEHGTGLYFVAYNAVKDTAYLKNVYTGNVIESVPAFYLKSPLGDGEYYTYDKYFAFAVDQDTSIAYSPYINNEKRPYFIFTTGKEPFEYEYTHDGVVKEKYTYHQTEVVNGNKSTVFGVEGVYVNDHKVVGVLSHIVPLTAKPRLSDEDAFFGNFSDNSATLVIDSIKDSFSVYELERYTRPDSFDGGDSGEERVDIHEYPSDRGFTAISVCISKRGDLFLIEKDSVTGKKRYRFDNVVVTSPHLRNCVLLDAVEAADYEPLVVLSLDNVKKVIEETDVVYQIFVGDKQVYKQGPGDVFLFGTNSYAENDFSEFMEAVAVYNPETLEVQEFNRHMTKTIEKNSKKSLSQEEAQKFLRLARLLARYKELSLELKEVRLGFVGEETNSEELILFRMNTVVGELRSILEFDKRKLYIFGENALNHYTSNYTPTEILNAVHTHLDEKSKSSYNQLIKSIFPDLMPPELRRNMQNSLASIFTGSDMHGMPQNSREVGEQFVPSNLDREMTFFGDDAENNFRSGEPIGKILPATFSGVIENLSYQKGAKWIVLEMPPNPGKVAENKTSTRYIQYVPANLAARGGEFQLYLQPNTILDENSVVGISENGSETPLKPYIKKGYYMVDLPVGTTELHFKDKKTEVQLFNCDWKSYANFRKEVEEKYPDVFAGLTEQFPLDARLELQMKSYENMSPLKYVAQMERLCEGSGHYDFKNAETAKDRVGLNPAQTLAFAQSRASALRINDQKNSITEKQYYAGVCYDSALLLVAMLRRKGILAGIVGELRSKADGVYTTTDAHASVFALWPLDNGQGYQVIYCDGTFINNERQADVPHAITSLHAVLEDENTEVLEDELSLSGKFEVEEKEDSKEEPLFKPGQETKVLLTEDNHEKALIEKLCYYDHESLVSLYEVLLEAMYAPVAAETIEFKKAQSLEERWNWLHLNTQIIPNVSASEFYSYTDAGLINSILLELRKAEKN